MKKFILYLLCFISFISCNKESQDDPCTDPSNIRKVKSGDLDIQEITYNSSCQIKESIQRSYYKKYTYNSDNKLIKLEKAISFDATSCYMQPGASGETFTDPRKAKPSQYSLYEYTTDGLLSKRSDYFLNAGNPQLVSYLVYHYNNNQIEKIEAFNPDNRLASFRNFTYNENGNVTRDEYYLITNNPEPQLRSIMSYEFDDKVNPFRVFSVEGDPGQFSNPNNIIKQKQTYFYDGVPTENNSVNVFEYNGTGLPVKANTLSYIYGN